MVRTWSRHRRRRAVLAWLVLLGLSVSACSSSSERAGEGASASPSPTSWTRLSPTELDTMLKDQDLFLVNVHVPYEGEIPSTDAFIPYDQIASRLDELPSDPSTLVLYCRSGNMSTVASQTLLDAGFTGFSELAGGFEAWKEAGLPFVVTSPST